MQGVTAIEETEGNVYMRSVCLAMLLRVEKQGQTERSQIRGCCYAADQRAFVFGAMHIIALSPASSSDGDRCALCV